MSLKEAKVLLQEKAEIYAIGVGSKVTQADLLGVADGPIQVLLSDSFAKLDEALEKICGMGVSVERTIQNTQSHTEAKQ